MCGNCLRRRGCAAVMMVLSSHSTFDCNIFLCLAVRETPQHFTHSLDSEDTTDVVSSVLTVTSVTAVSGIRMSTQRMCAADGNAQCKRPSMLCLGSVFWSGIECGRCKRPSLH